MVIKTRFVKIQGQKIAWYESKQEGSPVVFVHGNSLSANTFIRQFQDSKLTEKHRLIAFDLPGHGNSEKSKEPEKTYCLPGFLSIMIDFIDKLDLLNAIIVGHSLGGHLVLDALENLSKAKAFVIFGTPPINFPPKMEDYFLPNPVFPLAYKPDLTEEELNSLASAFVNSNSDVLSIVKKDFERTHQEMRGYLGASLLPENLTNEAEIIKNMTKPIAIFHGKDDQLVNLDYIRNLDIPSLWQNKVQIISNAGHCPQLENPNEFNLKLKSFLDQII